MTESEVIAKIEQAAGVTIDQLEAVDLSHLSQSDAIKKAGFAGGTLIIGGVVPVKWLLVKK